MPRISAAIITKNESANIRRCLESLCWVDDIVVVDCGSTDDTLEICREFNCRVFHREWDGFAAQKNFSLSMSDADWVLSIDADEAVTAELAEEIRGVMSRSDYSAYEIPRQNFFLGKPMRHGGWYPDRQLRLLRKGIGEFANVPLHEHIRFSDDQVRVRRLKNPLLHHTYPSVNDFLAKADRYTDIEVDTAIKEGHAPKSLIFSMVTAFPSKFGEVYLYKGGWKDGLHGFIAAVLMSVRVFVRYAKMWQAFQQK
ncbi:MAG TPA: glycosyltransferase family 2 protein [Armatimonadota bacterium]|jgi:glycosyltransferase involved in cell wall biosynthesis